MCSLMMFISLVCTCFKMSIVQHYLRWTMTRTRFIQTQCVVIYHHHVFPTCAPLMTQWGTCRKHVVVVYHYALCLNKPGTSHGPPQVMLYYAHLKASTNKTNKHHQ